MGDQPHLDLENSMPPQSVLAGLASSHFSLVFTRLLAPSPRRGGRLAFWLPIPIVYDVRRQQHCPLLATHCLNGMRRTLVACGVTLSLIMLGCIPQVLQGQVWKTGMTASLAGGYKVVRQAPQLYMVKVWGTKVLRPATGCAIIRQRSYIHTGTAVDASGAHSGALGATGHPMWWG